MKYQKFYFVSTMFVACLALFSQCENDDSNENKESNNSKVVSSAGGTLTSTDNNVTVTIPDGVFNQNTKVTVTSTDNNENPGGVGAMYHIESDIKQFDKPVQLTFHYTNSIWANSLPAEVLTISYREDGSSKWKVQPNAQLNKSDLSLTVSTNHFSDWTISLLDSGFIDIAIPEDTIYFNIPNYSYQNVNRDVDQQYADSLNILFQHQQDQTGFRAGLIKNGSYDPVTANNATTMNLYIYSDQNLLYSGEVSVTFSDISATPGQLVGGTFSGTVTRESDAHQLQVNGKFYFQIR